MTTSSYPMMAFAPSVSGAGQAALSSAVAADPKIAILDHMPSIQFDEFAYALNHTQTGCLRDGALPLALASNDTCLLGFHCPRSNASYPPQYCHPTEECQVKRDTKQTCVPQGIVEPKVCTNGTYCPSGGKEEIICPAGFFCPTGSYQPIACALGALCPEGSRRQILTIPLVATVAIDILLVLAIAIGLSVGKWKRNRPRKPKTSDGGDLFGDPSDLPRSPPASVSPRRISSAKISMTGALGTPSRKASTQTRRLSGRVDHFAGSTEDDAFLLSDEDDICKNPDMQRFITSMGKTIETSSIGLGFDFDSLSFSTRQGKQILCDITGTIPRGSCWGVMGGSGAGKSTFVNVLMGKTHATGGTIKINGHRKDMSKYKKLIGYVPQDDIVFPELTVRENILHSARVRLPARWRDRAIQDHVDALIACLQLTHVQHSLVGDASKPVISGGQRKRVNIGMELAAAPMAIFLDEPTSGLDATSAASTMRLLRAISRLGVTAIAIVHQPREDIFYGFDQLLLLSQGRSVYNGPTGQVQTYFEGLGFAFPQRANPADILIDIITGDGAQYTTSSAAKDQSNVFTLINEWKSRRELAVPEKSLSVTIDGHGRRPRRPSNQSLNSTEEQEESLRNTMKARGATWPAQVYYCWQRAMTQQLRNRTSFIFEIGVGGLAGIIIGLSAFASNGHLFQGVYHPPFTLLSSAVDYTSTPQIGLLGAMAIGLAASAPGFWVFGEEKLMYWREAGAGHSRSAYYVGKLLSTLLRIALSSLHFTVLLGVLATPLIGFQQMYAANLMYFWCIYGLASVVSMLVKREDGPLLAVLASLVIGVLGGVAPPLSKVKHWHVEWFWRMSPGVWFTEAYFTENLTPLSYLYMLPLAEEVIGFTLGQFSLDIAMLFLIGIVYRIVAYFGLICINRDRQR